MEYLKQVRDAIFAGIQFEFFKGALFAFVSRFTIWRSRLTHSTTYLTREVPPSETVKAIVCLFGTRQWELVRTLGAVICHSVALRDYEWRAVQNMVIWADFQLYSNASRARKCFLQLLDHGNGTTSMYLDVNVRDVVDRHVLANVAVAFRMEGNRGLANDALRLATSGQVYHYGAIMNGLELACLDHDSEEAHFWARQLRILNPDYHKDREIRKSLKDDTQFRWFRETVGLTTLFPELKRGFRARMFTGSGVAFALACFIVGSGGTMW